LLGLMASAAVLASACIAEEPGIDPGPSAGATTGGRVEQAGTSATVAGSTDQVPGGGSGAAAGTSSTAQGGSVNGGTGSGGGATAGSQAVAEGGAGGV